MAHTHGIDRGTFKRGRTDKVKLLADASGTSDPVVEATFEGNPWTVSNVSPNPRWLMFDLTPPAKEPNSDETKDRGTLGDLTITIKVGQHTSTIVTEVNLDP